MFLAEQKSSMRSGVPPARHHVVCQSIDADQSGGSRQASRIRILAKYRDGMAAKKRKTVAGKGGEGSESDNLGNGARALQVDRTNRELRREMADRLAAEEALRAEKEMAERLIETARVIILVLDRQGRIVQYNRYMEELTGVPLADVQGQDWFSTFIPERDRPQIRSLYGQATRGKRTHGNINPILTRDGKTLDIEWDDSELTDGHGEQIGVIAIGQDITERKRLHEQLLTIAEAERRRIGQQLHDDIGQELIGLGLTMDMLVESLEAEGSREIPRTRRVVEGVSRVLDKIRMLTRGMVVHDLQPEELATELESLARQIDQLPNVHCIFHCAPDVIVRNDQLATQLYHICQEAVTNALKHGGAEMAEIRISLITEQQRTMLTVRDNGRGIDGEVAGEGGSGLHIMNYRAGMIDARLSVGRDPTGGTVVRCEVPVGQGPEDNDTLPFSGL